MFRYLRFFFGPVMVMVISTAMYFGGIWLWLPSLLQISFVALLDQAFPYDLDERPYQHSWLLDLALYLSLPATLWLFLSVMWAVGSGTQDPLGIGALMHSLSGVDVVAARANTAWYHYLPMCVVLLITATGAGGLAGHELTHRTSRPFDLWLGRISMAILWGVAFPIEHVYGHHAYVSTPKDPATAARGDSLYQHFPKSLYRTVTNAWEIEQARLAKLGLSFWSTRNALLRMSLVSACFTLLAYYLAGWAGVALHVLLSLEAKLALEALNYIEHYGLVRLAGEPVQPRHSWNCNHAVSGVLTYNLTRHSHHHADAQVHFQDLRSFAEQPQMPGGFMTAFVSAWVPWLWRKRIVPKLLTWDREQASPREYKLIHEANLRSGWPELMGSVASAPQDLHAARPA